MAVFSRMFKIQKSRFQVDLVFLMVYLSIALLSFKPIFGEGIFAVQDLAPMYRLEQLFRPFEFPWDSKSNLGFPQLLTGNMMYNIPLISLSALFGSVTLAHKVFIVLIFVLSLIHISEPTRPY